MARLLLRVPKLGEVLDRVEHGTLVRERRVEVVLLALLVDGKTLEDNVPAWWHVGR